MHLSPDPQRGLAEANHDKIATIFVILIGFLFVYFFAAMFWNQWQPDLSALYMAGKSVAAGHPEAIYAAPPNFFTAGTPTEWVPLAKQIGHADKVILPYLYPPIWAHLMAPLTEVMAPTTFFNIVLVLQLAMLATMPYLGWQIARPEAPSLRQWAPIGTIILAVSAPGLGAIIQNQPQITVTFLTLLGALASLRGRPVTAGLLLALAAAIKLQPALFGLIFLLKGNWRAAIAMTLGGILLLALSLLISGPEAHFTMLARLSEINAMVVYTKVNYSLEVLLYQLHQLATGSLIPDGTNVAIPILDAPQWIELLPKLCLLAGAGWLALKRHAMSEPQIWLALSLLIAMFGPLSWGHYFVLALALLPVLFTLTSPPVAWCWVAAFALLFSYPLYSTLLPYNVRFMATLLPPLAMLYPLTLFVLHPSRP
jgi:Predicted integral membrane protein